jgi:peptidoglycan/LPS O-acetylase OafA/YrhL
MLPLLVIGMNRARLDRRRQAIALCALAGVVLVWRCVLVFHGHVSEARTYYSTDTRADSLLLGCALALWGNPVLDEVRGGTRRAWGWAVAGGFAIIASLAYRNFQFREGFRYTIQAAALVFIIRYVVLAPTSWAGRFLNHRIMVWIGQLSFAFYLVHQIVLFEVEKHVAGKVPRAAISLVLSVALAWLLQRSVMTPAAKLRQRLEARRTSRAAAELAST